jgi:hypothetical protein
VGELIDAAELVIGWGTRERIDGFLGGLSEHGPVSWDPKAVDLLAERTGISRATAALLLAALPNLDAWESTFLTTEQRTLLGLKTLCPLHDLFTHSWQRVQSGDRPT